MAALEVRVVAQEPWNPASPDVVAAANAAAIAAGHDEYGPPTLVKTDYGVHLFTIDVEW